MDYNQLFYNLIHNALKFSKAEEPPRVIITFSMINAENSIESLEIKIKDNGIGMNQIYSEKIFNTFERLLSKDEFEGWMC